MEISVRGFEKDFVPSKLFKFQYKRAMFTILFEMIVVQGHMSVFSGLGEGSIGRDVPGIDIREERYIHRDKYPKGKMSMG